MPRRWLFKTEPEEYSYDDLERDNGSVWDGVHNHQALKNLGQIKLGDEVLIYHTGSVKAIIGIAEAMSDPYPDPNSTDEELLVLKLKPKRRLPEPVTLAAIKEIEGFNEFDLVRLPRLSVMPISKEYWELMHESFKL